MKPFLKQFFKFKKHGEALVDESLLLTPAPHNKVTTSDKYAKAPKIIKSNQDISIVSAPEKLPKYETVISGNDDEATIGLGHDDHQDFVVVKCDRKNVLVIADEKLHGQYSTAQRIRRIRGKITNQHLEIEQVIWATSALIESIKKSRSSKTDAESKEEAGNKVSQTEPGQLFESWVRYALKENATDIHIMVRQNIARVNFRVDGELEEMRTDMHGQYFPNEVRDAVALVYNKLMENRSGSHAQFVPSEFLYCMIPFEAENTKITLRFQSIREVGGYDVIMRVLKLEEDSMLSKLTYEQLGYLPSQCAMLEKATMSSSGILLIAGVTGSGKSTTLKTVMESMPHRDGMKLYSVEDPVEYKIKGVTQIPIQRNVKDAKASEAEYRLAYASLMRADPDAIMIGEIRDNVSGVAALTQAETGHMALGTVHANRVVGIAQRLVSPAIGLDLHALTSPGILNLLIYQALVPLLCPRCKIPYHKANDYFKQRVDILYDRLHISQEHFFARHEIGCDHCRQRGTKGMTVVAEMLAPDQKFLSLIRERREFEAEKYWRSHSDNDVYSQNMQGKSVFDNCLYKAILGQIDPTQCERFENFEDIIPHP